jgi:hypothetical protein
MSSVEKRGTPVRITSGNTTATFERAGDRWRHVIAVAGTVILESVEDPDACGDPRWPMSPALTEVSLVEAAGRPVILGLGLAGRSHFSVSVAAHPQLPDTLLFEVACRIQEPPGWLGSTYRRPDGSVVRAAAADAGTALPRTVQWVYTMGPVGLDQEPAAAGPRRP